MAQGPAIGQERRVALVTGGAQGLGAAIVRHLARLGMTVACVDCNPAAEDVVHDLRGQGHDAHADIRDLADPQAAAAAVQALATRCGRIDVLVNNAGVGRARPTVEELQPDEWDHALAVNLTAPFLLAREAMPLMKAAGGGRIVNIGSRAARTALAGADASYAASKAGLVAMSRQLALQGAPFGITSNAICPGRFDTALGAAAPGTDASAGIPVGRIGDPAEIGTLVAFLISEEAAYITGAVIDINGGSLMI